MAGGGARLRHSNQDASVTGSLLIKSSVRGGKKRKLFNERGRLGGG